MTVSVLDRLKSVLPVHLYGVGGAKSWDSLIAEIGSGEATVRFDGSRPVRQIVVLRVSVVSPDGKSCLKELYQEFADGRKRERGILGVSEKIRANEDIPAAVGRALAEELGVSQSDFVLLGFRQLETELKSSPSYPGLETEYVPHLAEVQILKSGYRPEYIERQSDKKTVFGWVEVCDA